MPGGCGGGAAPKAPMGTTQSQVDESNYIPSSRLIHLGLRCPHLAGHRPASPQRTLTSVDVLEARSIAPGTMAFRSFSLTSMPDSLSASIIIARVTRSASTWAKGRLV